jgi:hypothetical protein
MLIIISVVITISSLLFAASSTKFPKIAHSAAFSSNIANLCGAEGQVHERVPPLPGRCRRTAQVRPLPRKNWVKVCLQFAILEMKTVILFSTF